MMTTHYEDDLVTVHHGDCLDVLRSMPDASVDAVVTDPPYGLGFMGKEWDSTFVAADMPMRRSGAQDAVNAGAARQGGRQRAGTDYQRRMARDSRDFGAWCEEWVRECLRVLKPGGHLLTFGGTRTWHRLACAVEDAGFEMRDSIAWLYGSGFPKSLDVSKAIDKAAGAERQVVGPNVWAHKGEQNTAGATVLEAGAEKSYVRVDITAPATDGARTWQGWGTALKPAFEPIVVGRKPLAGTVAGNVLLHGTGALNIDACRVDWGADGDKSADRKAKGYSDAARKAMGGVVASESSTGFTGEVVGSDASKGRWPANVLLGHSSECVRVGTRTETVGGGEKASGGFVEGYEPGDGFVGRSVESPVYRCGVGCQVAELDRQSGVLTSGANPTRRGSDKFRDAYGDFAGQETCEPARGADSGGASRFFPTFRYEAKAPTDERPRDGDVAHPTVKPLDLMRWLVRLVTPGGGLVLDPFAGSGTTAEACVIEGFRCITIEREATYLPLIVARLSKPIQPDLFGGAA